MKKHLNQWDIYRRIPKDLTEPTALGGAVTIVSMIILLLLTFFEIRNFMTKTIVTSVLIDHSEDSTFQLNFNITIKGLSCEFAAIDLRNIIGKDREDVNERTVHKFTMDGNWAGFAEKDETVHDYGSISQEYKDHYGNPRHAIELTPANFQSVVNDYEAMLIDFHAPWCSHCRNLAPIYEHAAELVKEKAPKTIDTHHKHSVALCTVDCTVRENLDLCRMNHIQAFPTIRVFRQGRNKEDALAFHNLEHYESYNGRREAEAISDFALEVLKQVIAGDPELQVGDGVDSTGDGKQDSTVHSKAGCRIEGYLMLQRVPGQLIIRAHSSGHAFNNMTINMDHKINHLSFGQHARKILFDRFLNKDLKESLGIPTIGEEGAYAGAPMARPLALMDGVTEVGFEGAGPGYSHEHYVKVVSRTHLPYNGEPINTYEYTINSNSYKPKTEGETPKIAIVYDVSPLLVSTRETRKPWIEGLTSMCAIIGGVYTCTTLIEALLQKAFGGLSKKIA